MKGIEAWRTMNASTRAQSGESTRDILNIDEAAELLGVSIKTFNKVLHHENMPARKIGREWKFSRRALIDWVGNGRSQDFYREDREGRGSRDERGWATRTGDLPRRGECPRRESRRPVGDRTTTHDRLGRASSRPESTK